MTEQLTAPASSDSHLRPPEGGSLALQLRRGAHELGQRLIPSLHEHGLSPEHWQIVSVLLARPGIGMSELAAAAVLPAATLTRHMDRLVERALVVRRIDPADKRRVVAALSPRGHAIASTIRAAEHRIEQEWVARLDPATRAALTGLSDLTVQLDQPAQSSNAE